MQMRWFIGRCPNMAVKEAEENDILDDDDDNAEADSVGNGTVNKKSRLLAEAPSGGRSQHKCGRKPAVCSIIYIGSCDLR